MHAAKSPNSLGRSLRLGELVERLGPRTITSLGALGADAPVLGTEFYDAMDEPTEQAGVLLIVPSGASLDVAALAALAAQSAELGCAALALKCPEETAATLAAISETSGVPILRVASRVGWRLFEALVAGALGEQRSGEGMARDSGAEPLFALANELASHFGGSVAIEDLGRRIVAYSAVPGQAIDSLRTRGILARRVPDSPFNDDQYRTVIRSETPLRYPQLDGELPRVACAIRAGALPLGTIWAIDAVGEGPLAPEQAERMLRAADLAAAHMLDDVRVRAAGQAPREELLRTMLSGGSLAGSELVELGIPEERGATLLAFDPGADDHPTALAQLRTTVQRHLSLHRPEATSVARGGRVYTLIAYEAPEVLARMTEPLLPILDRLIGTERSTGTVIALPGRTHRVSGVSELRERADWLFDTAARASATPASATERVLTVEALRPRLLLSRVAELFAADETLVDRRLAALSESQPAVADAVLRWCESFGNVTRAAAAAGVHENTIRYRLRNAEDRAGLTLGEPEALLATWLQLLATRHGATT